MAQTWGRLLKRRIMIFSLAVCMTEEHSVGNGTKLMQIARSYPWGLIPKISTLS